MHSSAAGLPAHHDIGDVNALEEHQRGGRRACRGRDVNPMIFDEAPWLYDRYRPGYPSAVLDALMYLARLAPGSRALEVGAGTGQLTISLASRGLTIVALEPGRGMAQILSRKLEPYPDARVITSRFEDAAITPSSFEVVVAATAFHWVDSTLRYRLAASALRPGGALAVLRNDHVFAASSAAYYTGASEIYRHRAPEIGPPFRPPKESDLPSLSDELGASQEFEFVEERRFAWDQRYTSSQLIGLLRTYSNHRALPPNIRAELLSDIKTFVDTELGGAFVDRYVTTLCIGRDTSPDPTTDSAARSRRP